MDADLCQQGLDFDAHFSNIKSAAMGGLSDLRQELQAGVDDLHGLRRDLTADEKWAATFQKKHHLDRPAKIATPRGSFFKWALIVLLVLVELFTNGELLSKGSELGLLGGIVEALIFAVLNVGVALMFGIFAIPYLNHRNMLLKLFGFLSLLAYFACLIGLNLALAHYREVSGAITEGAGELVMQRLLTDPMGLQDLRSWLLFGLGVLFSIIAVIDGVMMYDAYPGYQRVDQALPQSAGSVAMRGGNPSNGQRTIPRQWSSVSSLVWASRSSSLRSRQVSAASW